jgi:hypothetical protein
MSFITRLFRCARLTGNNGIIKTINIPLSAVPILQTGDFDHEVEHHRKRLNSRYKKILRHWTISKRLYAKHPVLIYEQQKRKYRPSLTTKCSSVNYLLNVSTFKHFNIQSRPLILPHTNPIFVKFISHLPQTHQSNGLYLNCLILHMPANGFLHRPKHFTNNKLI